MLVRIPPLQSSFPSIYTTFRTALCSVGSASSYASLKNSFNHPISTQFSSLWLFVEHLETMDSVKAEKLQAMEKYRRSQFPQMLFQFALRVVLLGLFMSSPNWLPIIWSFVRLFFVVCLPNVGAMVTGPKFIFMVSNIIIVFLVGESRLAKSAAQPDVYYEYAAARAQSLQSVSNAEVKEKEKEKEQEQNEAIFVEPLLAETNDKDDKPAEKEKEVEEDSEVARSGEAEEEEEQRQGLEEEEEEGLPAEELNKRVEDFIAKVNMQRKLEAKMLICCA